MAEALYRKYRPQVFEDVVGQEPIERTLKNAITQDKVSHAYLFCGPRGTGKTTTARLLAKALLCQDGPTPNPDGTCEDCQLIAEGAHPDVYELDAASRTGVENVREEIISRVQFAPTRGRSKVYIIDEVHMLSTAAFNALLKTLEEPPSHVVFILCTTDPQKVPETIHSRCQRFDFHRIAPESMVARLGAICIAEEVEFEGEALDLIAQRAEGGLRNALTSLEQIIAFENGKVTLAGAERLLGAIDSNDMAEIISHIGKRDIASCFRWTSAYVETGADLAQFVRDMAEHVRNLYVLSLAGDEVELDVSETSRRELASELQWFGPDRASRLLGVLGDLSAELKTSSNPRLSFEIALTRMVRPDSDLTLESLAERVEALESGYSAVAHVVSGSGVVQSDSEPLVSGEPSGASVSGTIEEPRLEEPRLEESRLVGGHADSPEDSAQVERGGAAVAAPAADGGSPAEAGAPAGGQAAEPAPAASPESRSALANPAALQRIWQAALNAVKREKPASGVMFMNTKAVFDESTGEVRVLFPADSEFTFNAAHKPKSQEALAEALAKAAGEKVAFRFELMDGSSGSRAGRTSSASRRALQGGAGAAQQAASVQPASEQRAAEQRPAVRDAGNQAAGQGADRRVADQDASGQASAGVSVRQGSGGQTQPRQEASGQVPAHRDPSASRQASSADSASAYDQVPYEDAPYDEVPYEEVPYGEFDAPFADQQGGRPAGDRQSASRPASDRQQHIRPEAEQTAGQPEATPPAPDASTAPSPSDNRDENGALREDPADVEGMLQASFGGKVVFSEVEDE